ncbi:RDD family protein [Amylibacter sp. IMCC11727]|uniref:RDD family protein n=1 Tax=Amylibacter sp. IMCC11727 TaxID=3039851 RepID=UPI00244DFF55|nr:RDD family protein [Amylibacter sp. IMCC11727]WGI20664.1 RDD family protein [Amylibacter sp. IMCC11727]
MQISHLPDPKLDAQFYAGVPIKRLVAWGIDFLVVFVFSIALVIVTAGLGAFIFPLLIFIANLGYRIGCLYKWSATLGMRMVGIEIRNMNGDRVDQKEAVFHTGLYVLITMTGLGIPATALAMLINDRGQGLHDMVLGTTAINRPLD